MYAQSQDGPAADRPGRFAAAHNAPSERRSESSRAKPVARDPFFDQPYQPSENALASAGTEPAIKAPNARGISANIKPKLRVAALFKSE
jgi:hypothetical protein